MHPYGAKTIDGLVAVACHLHACTRTRGSSSREIYRALRTVDSITLATDPPAFRLPCRENKDLSGQRGQRTDALMALPGKLQDKQRLSVLAS